LHVLTPRVELHINLSTRVAGPREDKVKVVLHPQILACHTRESRFSNGKGGRRDGETGDTPRDIGGTDGAEQERAGPPGGNRIDRHLGINVQCARDGPDIPLETIGKGPVPSRDVAGQGRGVLEPIAHRGGTRLGIDTGPIGGGFEIVVGVPGAGWIGDVGLIGVRPGPVGRRPGRVAQVVVVRAGVMQIGLVDRQIILGRGPAGQGGVGRGIGRGPSEGGGRSDGGSTGSRWGESGSGLGAGHLIDQHIQPEGFLGVIPIVR